MNKSKKKIKRIDKEIINGIINAPHLASDITEGQQAEMAIPSYLNKNPFIRALFWNRYDLIYTLAEPDSEMSVCEFGCGIGVFLPTLAPEVKKVYAVDIFPQYAQEMGRIYDLEVAFSKDIDAVPDNSLDLIVACEVMEHLEDPGEYTRLFARKLKPGGRLIMSGPTETWIYKLGRILAGYHKYHDYHPHNVYQLHEIIIQNGFKSIVQRPYPWKIVPLYMINVYAVDSR
jgi:2-polyprenyl-3-methyl-5-hydroxy-6-metoxy-1,4-benzoquinol methylase